MKIAVFHNTAGEGGARRALASLLRHLHYNHTIDIYTCIPITENIVPISDAVEALAKLLRVFGLRAARLHFFAFIKEFFGAGLPSARKCVVFCKRLCR